MATAVVRSAIQDMLALIRGYDMPDDLLQVIVWLTVSDEELALWLEYLNIRPKELAKLLMQKIQHTVRTPTLHGYLFH